VGGAVGHLKSPLKSTLKWESGKTGDMDLATRELIIQSPANMLHVSLSLLSIILSLSLSSHLYLGTFYDKHTLTYVCGRLYLYLTLCMYL